MQAFNKQPIRELTPAEDYLLNEKGDNYEHGSGWSEDYQDPSKFWGHGMSHVYCNRNVAFRLKEEKWHGLTSMIIKPNHIEVLINKTPFSKPELKKALIEVWFGSLAPFDQNENRRQARNQQARNRRAKLKEANNGL